MPKLSVIVPIWGVEKYIEKCARSLFESSFDDMEFVFVDDCTPDNSIAVVEQVLEDYPQRKTQTVIVHHEVNKGLPQARKTGYEASHGKWIYFCDSDDWVEKNMFSNMLAKAEEGGHDMVCCDFIFLSDTETLWAPTYSVEKSASQLRMDLIEGKISNAVWNKIVRRDIYHDNGVFFPLYSMDEDDVMTAQWAYYAKNIGYVHECLYYHYDNPESMTKKSDPAKERRKLIERIENRKQIVCFLEKHNADGLLGGGNFSL